MRRQPRVPALLLLGSIVVSMLASSSAPTPLYATYAERWEFSPITVTVVFAVYAVAVLSGLLILGRLSNYVGRRPVLVVTLVAQTIAVLVLAEANGVEMLVAGRLVQGVSTGAAMGALGAALLAVDVRWGTIVNTASPGLGAGCGVLVAASLVQYAPAPTHLVYLCLAALFALQAVGVVLLGENGRREPMSRRAFRPDITLPAALRGPVAAAAPILFAVWALTGFYGSLGPSLAHRLSGSDSPVLGALGLSIISVLGALTTIMLRKVATRKVILLGTTALIVWAAGAIVSIALSSVTAYCLFFLVAGFGFGAGFQGGMRTVLPLVADEDRAGVLSVLYIVCYLGMGLPSVVTGFFVAHGARLDHAATGYSLFVIVLAVMTAIATLRVAAETGRRQVS